LVPLLSSEHVHEGGRGGHEDVDAPQLVAPRGEVAIGAREVEPRGALAAELDQLTEQERGLRAVEAAEVARAREVLELDGRGRIRAPPPASAASRARTS
jgi:hypothetical protein